MTSSNPSSRSPHRAVLISLVALLLPALAQAEETPAVSQAAPTWSVKWSNGTKVERSDGQFKLKFGGRIQSDFGIIEADRGLEDFVGGGSEGFGTEFRRARIFFSGTVYEVVDFKAQYDLEDGDSDFKDVFVRFLCHDNWDVTVGHFKQPFSLEEQTSSKYITFLERSISNSAFSQGRDTGLMVTGRFFDDHFTWAAGGFLNVDKFGELDVDGFDNKENFDLTTRFAFAPIYADGGARVLHVDTAYSLRLRGNGMGPREVSFDSKGETNLGATLVDTGAIANAEYVHLLNTGAAAVFGPFSVQAEVTGTFVERNSGFDDVAFVATYLEASWFLTGEHRNYELGEGAFGRLTPNKPFNPSKGQWGAFQVATRFSFIDLDDEDVDGGELRSATLALNWYLLPNLRIMLNALVGDLEGQGNQYAGTTRVQIDF